MMMMMMMIMTLSLGPELAGVFKYIPPGLGECLCIPSALTLTLAMPFYSEEDFERDRVEEEEEEEEESLASEERRRRKVYCL